MKNKKAIEQYLLGQIEKDNPVQVEKVQRYLNLLDIFYKLDQNIKDYGTLVETKNASQTFLKTNPAVAEKSKVNSSLLSIEKSFGFEKIEIEESPTSSGLL
ncbi:P27 family phage terminase small subunit [Staphylococcus saprophyticus]|uniref:P27 family phage terminase small subunit n=1 Tax=Staphylococcus saprophyticus TaxID=29385 RepID=UPI00301B13C9